MRPTRDEWAIQLAFLTSERATCCRRKVGCILTNSRGHIIATGYNGVAAGLDHCHEGSTCIGANSPSGQNLDGCQAIHAEQNALLQCKNVYEIETCYVTTAPCMTCTKLLMNTSCQRIVYGVPYTTGSEPEQLWLSSKRQPWVQLPPSVD
jgi:dCMP deaminase